MKDGTLMLVAFLAMLCVATIVIVGLGSESDNKTKQIGRIEHCLTYQQDSAALRCVQAEVK